jgi:hypothetical protein
MPTFGADHGFQYIAIIPSFMGFTAVGLIIVARPASVRACSRNWR